MLHFAYVLIIVSYHLSKEQRLLKVIYSMIKHSRKTHLLICNYAVKYFGEKAEDGKIERKEKEWETEHGWERAVASVMNLSTGKVSQG